MKTERRHELQTNVLADWLGHHIEWIRPYGRLILAVLIIVILGVALGSYLISDQAARTQAGWSDYFAATFEENPDRLRMVARDHAGTTAGLWALQSEGDLRLARGLSLLFTDRESAEEALLQAQESYQQLLSATRADSDLHQSALFGLGKVYEGLNKLEEARDSYQRAIAVRPDSARAEEARRQLELLNDNQLISFYNWFARQKPAAPTDGLLDMPDLQGLPEHPDFSLPDLGDLLQQPDAAPPQSEAVDAPQPEQPDADIETEPDTARQADASPETGQAETGQTETGQAETGQAGEGSTDATAEPPGAEEASEASPPGDSGPEEAQETPEEVSEELPASSDEEQNPAAN